MNLSTFKSPIGNLLIKGSDQGIHSLSWVGDEITLSSNNLIIKEAEKQLEEYFSGSRKEFKLPLVLEGTVFQKQVWLTLLKIPYGKTISYSQQADLLGDIKKFRAVGNANSKNPIPIIVPCHRVIGKNGKLFGFISGTDKKEFLISLENKLNV